MSISDEMQNGAAQFLRLGSDGCGRRRSRGRISLGERVYPYSISRSSGSHLRGNLFGNHLGLYYVV